MKKLTKKIPKYAAHASARTLEAITSELALPAAIFSTAGDGNVVQRMYTGVEKMMMYAGSIGSAYMQNTGFRDSTNNGLLEIAQTVGAIGKNIAENPQQTAIAAAATYAAFKIVPVATRYARKRILPTNTQYGKRDATTNTIEQKYWRRKRK